MTERYSKLFSLPENLYAESSPVVVSAGNLLKDNQTGKVLAQLKIKNISEKEIKAATVLIHALDTTGKTIGGDIEQEYLDLSIKQGEEFGQKVAILLPNISTRGFTVEVKQVVFTDSSIWGGQDMNWEPLPDAKLLINEFGDAELVKQYRLKFGGECEVSPTEHKDLWRCACGTWNRTAKCYSCAKEKAGQLAFDIDNLKADKDARLAKEKEERDAKEAADKAAAVEKSKKIKKSVAIVAPVLAVCIVAFLVLYVFVPNIKYNHAVALLEEGKYEDAIYAFEALNGYKNSTDMIEEARYAEIYEEAERQFVAGNYDVSISKFSSIASYRDSSSRIMDVQFQQATDFVSSGRYKDAAAMLYSLVKKHYKGASDSLERIYPELYEMVLSSISAFNYTDAIDAVHYLPNTYKNVASLKTYLTVRSIDFNDGEAYNLADICDSIAAMNDQSLQEQLITETEQVNAILALNGKYVGDKKNIYHRTDYASMNGGRFYDDSHYGWEDIYYCNGRYYIPRSSYYFLLDDVNFSFRSDQGFTISNNYWSHSFHKEES